MRARNVLLALVIIAAGMTITASRRGVFADLSRRISRAADLAARLVASSGPTMRWHELERSSRRLPADGAASLVIENPYGEVSVVGGSQSFVGIEAVRWGAGNEPEEARATAPRAGLVTSRAGDAIIVKVAGEDTVRQRVHLHLSVTAPSGLDLEIKALAGPVSVHDMSGGVKVERMAGDVTVTGAARVAVAGGSGRTELREIRGPVDAKILAGLIKLADIDGEVNAETAAGDIQALNLKGPVTARTVSGTITLDLYAGANASLNTTSGDAYASLANPLTGHLSAKSVSGNVTVKLPPGSDYAFDISSEARRISTRDFHQTSGRSAPDHLVGVVGTGRGRLELRSVTGTVSLVGEWIPQPPRALWRLDIIPRCYALVGEWIPQPPRAF
ncbi:MAG TPA: DUF4097 family beta strand repeat-containing protein [Armatimonadota bacterium]|nr:DUF4097 family beta strand repeat-containing protein [Armatimonadota bacterium]